MNNRDYKVFAPNTYHHIYNRGSGKMDIFKDTQDFLNFQKRLKIVLNAESQIEPIHQPVKPIPPRRSLQISPLPNGSFTIIAYCLMPNHFHFLIRQNTDIPVSNLISKLCSSYGRYFNKKYERVGGLFQDQFKSIIVDNDQYFLWLSAYIHRNPIMADLVQNLNDYSYSSYLNYLELRSETLVDTSLILGLLNNKPEAYEKFVLQNFEKVKPGKDLEYLLLD
jgi:putative transposase